MPIQGIRAGELNIPSEPTPAEERARIRDLEERQQIEDRVEISRRGRDAFEARRRDGARLAREAADSELIEKRRQEAIEVQRQAERSAQRRGDRLNVRA